MRAVFLPTPGDPFLCNYWMQMAKKYWLDEVDTLYVLLDTPAEEEVVEYVKKVFDHPKVNLTYVPHITSHGQGIDMLLEQSTEEYIMLMEDDAFIFTRGQVSRCFAQIEAGLYDVIGSKRASCSMEICEKARERWGVDTTGIGDHGPNFWPNYFFCKREVLLQTDRNFDSKHWDRGDYIEALDWTVDVNEVVGDTFVHASLQIRDAGWNILCVPQYHANPHDLEDYDNGANIFNHIATWTHIGSLSSGFHGVLTDDQGRALGARRIIPPGQKIPCYCNTEAEKLEWERRVQLWDMAWENSTPQNIPEIHQLYREALDRLIVNYHLSRKHILKRKRIYKELGFI